MLASFWTGISAARARGLLRVKATKAEARVQAEEEKVKAKAKEREELLRETEKSVNVLRREAPAPEPVPPSAPAAGEAVEAWDTEADLALRRLSVSTAFYSVVRGVNFSDDQHATGVTPRRVSRKQSEPAWHLKLERERAEQQPEQKRVRSKYWGKSSFQQKQGGTFVCQIPGCGKAYYILPSLG